MYRYILLGLIIKEGRVMKINIACGEWMFGNLVYCHIFCKKYSTIKEFEFEFEFEFVNKDH